VKVIAGVHVPSPGDRVSIEHDGRVDLVTIRAVIDGGRKADIEFDSGSQLRVPMSMLGPTPAHVRSRSTDPETSLFAAATATAGMTHNQITVLSALAAAGDRGMIDHEHEAVNGLKQDTAGKRRGELADQGLVVDSGTRRKTPRGSKAIVWVLTPAGTATYRSLQRKGVA
jgi:hypothetical protein